MDNTQSQILQKVEILMDLYLKGKLGGKIMPEDSNPDLDKTSSENYNYFTLPMSLNYQRNSYALWESAHKSYSDIETVDIFSPLCVSQMTVGDLRNKLLKYKVALQPNKQPIIWQTICNAIMELCGGDLKKLFFICGYSVKKVKEYLLNNKKSFPYLSGTKIMNYWLYVMQKYTDLSFCDIENITIAPDTHIIQASVKLGLISLEQSKKSDVQMVVVNQWNILLAGTKYQPIDIHTPLWLWSRSKFNIEI